MERSKGLSVGAWLRIESYGPLLSIRCQRGWRLLLGYRREIRRRVLSFGLAMSGAARTGLR